MSYTIPPPSSLPSTKPTMIGPSNLPEPSNLSLCALTTALANGIVPKCPPASSSLANLSPAVAGIPASPPPVLLPTSSIISRYSLAFPVPLSLPALSRMWSLMSPQILVPYSSASPPSRYLATPSSSPLSALHECSSNSLELPPIPFIDPYIPSRASFMQSNRSPA